MPIDFRTICRKVETCPADRVSLEVVLEDGLGLKDLKGFIEGGGLNSPTSIYGLSMIDRNKAIVILEGRFDVHMFIFNCRAQYGLIKDMYVVEENSEDNLPVAKPKIESLQAQRERRQKQNPADIKTGYSIKKPT